MSPARTVGRGRVQVQWLVLAAALTVLAGLVVGWALTDAAERVDVVSIGRPVQAGELLTLDDLRIGQVAFDQQVTGLVPAAAATDLVGRVATIDLEPGTLLTAGMWAEDTGLRTGERTVAALLEPGRAPADLTRGDAALAVSIVDVDPATESTDVVAVARVLDVAPAETGGALFTLAVPGPEAAHVAQLAATDALVLVGAPDAVPTSAASTSTTPVTVTP